MSRPPFGALLLNFVRGRPSSPCGVSGEMELRVTFSLFCQLLSDIVIHYTELNLRVQHVSPHRNSTCQSTQECKMSVHMRTKRQFHSKGTVWRHGRSRDQTCWGVGGVRPHGGAWKFRLSVLRVVNRWWLGIVFHCFGRVWRSHTLLIWSIDLDVVVVVVAVVVVVVWAKMASMAAWCYELKK